MPYTTNVAGTTITAAWGNANVRDQVVTPFATAAARASAITSPVEGMVTYLEDSDRLEMYTGAAHVRVAPKGRVGGRRYNAGSGSALAAGITTVEAIVNMSTPTLTLEANRSFEIRAIVRCSTSTGAVGISIRIRETNLAGTQRGIWTGTHAASGTVYKHEVTAVYDTAGADESKTFIVTAAPSSGTVDFFAGDVSTAVLIEVIDIGPAGGLTVFP